MKLRWALLLITSFLLGAAEADKKETRDQEAIQGTWKVVGLRLEGQEILGDSVKEMKLVIKGDTMRPEGDFPEQEKYGKFTFKLDPTTTPKIFDCTLAAGDDKGMVLEGIYQLERDKLKLCVRLIGKERPGKLAAEAGSGLVLATLERIK